MCKQIVFEGWVSIVPDKMFDSWVKKKFIPRTAKAFGQGDSGEEGHFTHRFDLGEDFKWISDKNQMKELKAKGWKKSITTYIVESDKYESMNAEVSEWYTEVFDYVTKWLQDNNYIRISKGSFRGGFCAENDPNSDVVKNWGAPLALEENKVAQIKEKFGEIRVYFNSLNDEQRKQVDNFAKHVSKKFDCEVLFA